MVVFSRGKEEGLRLMRERGKGRDRSAVLETWWGGGVRSGTWVEGLVLVDARMLLPRGWKRRRGRHGASELVSP